jgi:type IV secretory pathway TraG/TraD family ATPase VirD4
MESTNNKLAPLTRDPDLKQMLGAKQNRLDFRAMMDKGQVFLADVGGCDRLLPSLMTTFFQLAAMSRLDTPPAERRPYYLFVDEFHTFTVGAEGDMTFSKILSGTRKYGLHLHLAHQHLDQLSDKLKKAIFGNVWTKVVFGVSEYDADDLARVMGLGYFDTGAVKREAQTSRQHPAWKLVSEQQTELAAQLATQGQARATVRDNAGRKAEIITNPVEPARRLTQDEIRALWPGDWRVGVQGPPGESHRDGPPDFDW